jgi:hypothetical protein
VQDLPDPIKALPDDDNWTETREAIPPKPFPTIKPPKVIYSDKPAEMIVFEGEPKLEPVRAPIWNGPSNTDSDVFFLKETSTWYILVSAAGSSRLRSTVPGPSPRLTCRRIS